MALNSIKNLNTGNFINSPSKSPLINPKLMRVNQIISSLNDSVNLSLPKKKGIPLLSPNELFKSSKLSLKLNTKTSSTTANINPNIKWNEQFTDNSVKSGGIPKGYIMLKNTDIPLSKVTGVAKEIRSKNFPLGTITPFEVDGRQLIAVDQLHYATTRNGKKVDVPEGLHGVTVFVKP